MDVSYDTDKIIHLLNRILEEELAGVVRYTHYSFMVFGYNRISIISWLRHQVQESLLHAEAAGEMVTTLGGHPSLAIGKLLESCSHDIGNILKESLRHELFVMNLYKELLSLVKNTSVMLEEYASKMVAAEEMHLAEVNKMLRTPGDIAAFADK